ncbi:single-stranded DNA-binding protein (plasmid) [Streptomyces graminifolii]|uniref:single-stranded DNA-binding protein n=1 Tax=Streptomyces graminifolii TaxID=1266771 RepID=UPI0040580B40
MAGETIITVIGNLVDDPELRFTPAGVAVAKFRIASTPRIFDRQANEWKDGDSLFLTCSVWRQVAENVAESLQRGMRVIVEGRLKQRSYEDNEGTKRTVYELDVEEVGPSLRSATARVEKVRRENGGYGNGGGQQQNGGGWNGAQRQQSSPPQQGGGGGWSSEQDRTGGWSSGQQPGGDPWASAPAGGSGGYSDEPPF